MSYSVISFDGDWTLWDFGKVMRHALGKTLEVIQSQIHSPEASSLTIEQMIAHRNQVADRLGETTVNLELIRLEAFKATLAAINGSDDQLATELNALYLKHRFENIDLYDDTLPVLRELQSFHYQIILLSNGNSYPEKAGLCDLFDATFFSQDIGVAKPDPAIFEHVIAKLNVKHEQIIHIGDSLASDVAGANHSGITSIWLNRENKPNDTDIKPDHEITTLYDLLPIIKNS